ncbi:PIG-L family deacetylase [Danxiaibacter flavus]|uniref:PIG-L family deacetylase n=1 Tax=Danxiaibacter flavus TaxID=3049108 RepID=A0ABV3Z9K0_9BACT|nr:PIG-L family deacetylase [Chitinophagaceae bacterium DXS]
MNKNTVAKAYLLFGLFTSFIYSHLTAQVPVTYTSAEIYQQLKKLNVFGSVLYIAAHPDDENTRLLAYLAKEKQYRTGYLSLTRGDGGQNLIGDEQGIELGLIRTQELLAARRIDGPEQFFSRAYDFGFSKNAEEALKIWGHDKILSDVVWVIRKFRPDVIITRFPGDERAGHGHHWASALLANEAFKIAADSTKFPEQFTYGVRPWQAKRILWNTFNFGGTNTTSPDQFKIDVGVYNPVLGKGYGEIASESRSQHKSQGFGVARQRGESYEFFTTTGGSAPKEDLMEGIVTTTQRLAERDSDNQPMATSGEFKAIATANPQKTPNTNYDALQSRIDNIISNYNFEHPEHSVDSLVSLYKAMQTSSFVNSPWILQKLKEIQQLIVACSGIFLDVTSSSEYVVPESDINLQFFANKRNDVRATLESIVVSAFDTALRVDLPVNKNVIVLKRMKVPDHKEPSQPYWLEKPLVNGGSFDVANQFLIGNAENGPAYTATFVLNINGLRLSVNRPVQYKYTDPVKGELYQPLVVITPVITSMSPSVVLTNIKPGNVLTENPTLKVQYKSNINAANVKVTIKINQESSIVYSKDTVVNFEEGKTFAALLPLKEIAKKDLGKKLTVDIIAGINGKRLVFSHYLRTIQYDHIPHINYFYRDATTLVNEEIKTAGKKIGYIVGAGDKVPQSLIQMGYELKILTEAEVTDENLKQFDAIITGVRAYNVYPWITLKYDVLMNYIKNGGNLIVQYNTNSSAGPFDARIGPYPFLISRTRVTEENAKVNITLPDNSALNFPNKITSKDFDGWIQERSIYHAEQIDSHYQTPLSMKDSWDSNESKGSLIIAPYGKGNFVYTGIVFFRELPAGVGGAYRLMANLIGLPKNN